MSAPPPLTDRASLALHRRRAERRGMASFLHDLAADEIEERLAEVNRRFTEIAVVTGHPAVWRKRFPEARIVPDDDLLDLIPGAHDLVIHALGLHWANDPGRASSSRPAVPSPRRPAPLRSSAARRSPSCATALAEAEVALDRRAQPPRRADGRDPRPRRPPPARGPRAAGGRQRAPDVTYAKPASR